MKTKNNLRLAALLALAFIAGLAAYPVYKHLSTKTHSPKGETAPPDAEPQTWICSMHPHIRQNHPGTCPLCGMDLIPLAEQTAPAAADDYVQLSQEAVALANIQTTAVGHGIPQREIRLYGAIRPDERRLHALVAHIDGRIETLHVRSSGETVRRGQSLATLYSPDWITLQQELIEAQKRAAEQPALLEAAREKLRRLKFTEQQIKVLEETGRVSPSVDLTADATGSVLARRVEQGDYVAAGDVLFDLADLSAVWAVFDVYADDLPYLRVGQKLRYTLPALPGSTFSGVISFIDPVVDPATRTARLRVETGNPQRALKPGMAADAHILATLKGIKGALTIPKTAVLWTGARSIVYVKIEGTPLPSFRLREIELGESLGDAYRVISGLSEGEEVVTSGAFALDASAQLAGQASMMNGDAASKTATPAIEAETPVIEAKTPLVAASLTVQGLCGMCRQRIETTASALSGVSSVEWDAETKRLLLRHDPSRASLDAISRALAAVGHDTNLHKAPHDVYNALPACCKYREE